MFSTYLKILQESAAYSETDFQILILLRLIFHKPQAFWKMVPFLTLTTKGAKESAPLCDHDFSPIRTKRLKPADSLLKESSCDKAYMTLIQEINDQWCPSP